MRSPLLVSEAIANVILTPIRNRSDADGHLQILRRLIPNAKYVVMFNPEVLQPQQADTHYRTSGR